VLAGDGLEAAEKTYREAPDLIISDIEMPKMNGFQFCRLLKSDAMTKNIPIIMLTSKESANAQYWGMDTGADRYVLKSSRSIDIQNHISELLEEHSDFIPQKIENISQWDIVEKVNNLFDKRLMESKLVNEINHIVFDVHTLKEGIQELFQIFKKIMEYTVACFFSYRNNQTRVFFSLEDQVSEKSFKEIQLYLFKIAISKHFEISDEIEIEVFGNTHGEDVTVEPEHFFFLPMKSQSEQIGFFAFYITDKYKLTDENKNLCEKTQEAANLVIDNIHMYQQIRMISAIDPLTQIYNRRHFMEYFDTELSRCKRLNLRLSLIMLDIDDFKHVNDTYNHLSGDLVLKYVSTLIKASIRKMDIPARYGGEEFIVLLPETTKEDAVVVADRIRTNIETFSFFSYDKQPIKITVSLGVAFTSEEALLHNPLELIRIADNQLYTAKKSGKNRVCH
jgi:diguanylate cyclase (GGDEF)-like protein